MNHLIDLIGYAAIIFCVFDYFNRNFRELKGGSNKAESTIKRKKYKLIPFHDALADEIMILRKDITDINVRLREKDSEANCLPQDFLKLLWLYINYPYEAICVNYKAEGGSWGKIILILDDTGYVADTECGSWSEPFNAEKLRMMKSKKPIIIKKGMCFLIHLYEPDICKEHNSALTTEARVISVQEGEDYRDIILTLEIDLNYDPFYIRDVWDKREHIPKIITRKLEVYNIYNHGIRLEEKKKTFLQRLNSF